MDRKIIIVTLQCPGLSKPDGRPPGFGKEKCFKNLVETKDENTELIVFFDGDPKGNYVTNYQFPILQYENGGTCAKSARGLIAYLSQQNYDPDAILYIVEDDFMHRPGWPKILREAFSGTMRPSSLQPDYVTLYDHFDKYNYEMYDKLTSRIGCTESIHWRTIPSTTNTCAMLFRTFKEDVGLIYKYTTIDEFLAYDHSKFLELGEKGRTIISCIPGYSTHMETEHLSPCLNWNQPTDS